MKTEKMDRGAGRNLTRSMLDVCIIKHTEKKIPDQQKNNRMLVLVRNYTLQCRRLRQTSHSQNEFPQGKLM